MQTKNLSSFFFLVCLLYAGCWQSEPSKLPAYGKVMLEDYYPNGQVMSRIWYKDGKKDSLGIWYYENGNIEVMADYVEGMQIGPTTHYHENGQPEIYYFYNQEGDGSLMYSCEFSETGEIVKEKGQRLGIIFEKSDTIKLGDYFGFTAVVVKPPGTISTVYTLTKDESPDFKIRTTFYVKDKIPYILHYFENKGNQPMMVVSELKDTIRNNIRRDTISFTVTVE